MLGTNAHRRARRAWIGSAMISLVIALGGCTTPNPNYCDPDASLSCGAGKICVGHSCVAADASTTDTPVETTPPADGPRDLAPDATDGPIAADAPEVGPRDAAVGGDATDLALDRPTDMQAERAPPCTAASCLADGGLPFCDTDAGFCTSNCAMAPTGACGSILDGGMPICDQDAGRCTGCLSNADCTTGNRLFCVAGTCSTCNAASGLCMAKNPLLPACSTAGTCVECGGDGDCATKGNRLFCVSGTCSTCTAPPAAQTACATKNPLFPVCNTAGVCVECGGDVDCAGKTNNRLFCMSGTCSTCTTPMGFCATRNPLLPVCDPTGATCVECDVDADCKTATRPICNTASHTCGACRTDAQCTAKLGTATPNPGVCMSHQDGRCALDAETIYVGRFAATDTCINAPVVATDGTASRPLCNPNDAFALLTATRRLVVIRGSVTGINWTFASLPAEVSLVGHPNAASAPGLIVGVADPGVQITTGRIYLRGLQVKQSLIGLIIESGSVLRMDSVLVQGNMNGGLRIRSSGFDIVNSIFAANGGGIDPVVGLFGGVYLNNATAPPAGAPHHFAFNTVVNNMQVGIVATTAINVWASLLGGNTGGDTAGTMVNVPAQFSRTSADAANLMYDPSTFHILTGSSCKDLVDGVALMTAMTGDGGQLPAFDIDGQTRPQGVNYDCGADEFVAP